MLEGGLNRPGLADQNTVPSHAECSAGVTLTLHKEECPMFSVHMTSTLLATQPGSSGSSGLLAVAVGAILWSSVPSLASSRCVCSPVRRSLARRKRQRRQEDAESEAKTAARQIEVEAQEKVLAEKEAIDAEIKKAGQLRGGVASQARTSRTAAKADTREASSTSVTAEPKHETKFAAREEALEALIEKKKNELLRITELRRG